MIALNKIFLIITLLALQLSSSINFKFRFFNRHGKVIELHEFCSNYGLISTNRPNLNFCNQPQSLYFDEPSKKIRLATTTVYSDLELSFINKTDTMTIRIINSGYGANVSIDSLVFKPGYYAIKCDSRIINGKTLPDLPVLTLKTFDYKNAKADYYNFWIDEYKKLMNKYLPEEYASSKILRKIQRKYHIPNDDLNYKTAKQLDYK